MINYKALKYQWHTISWTTIILVLCNLKISAEPGPSFFFEGFDKMVHLGFFYILTMFSIFGSINYHKSHRLPVLTMLKFFAFSMLLGGGIEILQWKVFTYRSAEWWDFICDITGSAMAIVSYIFWHKKEYKHEKV